jgi:RES domain-containing protein
MTVYRITNKNVISGLKVSGNAARWNSKGKFIIYTSSSRALACLENIVHRSGEGLNSLFKVLVIELPDKVKITNININRLPFSWFDYKNYHLTQKIGDGWIEKKQTCILQVPSAIIKNEYNFIINPSHTDYKLIKIVRTEDFEFDPRLKK